MLINFGFCYYILVLFKDYVRLMIANDEQISVMNTENKVS